MRNGYLTVLAFGFVLAGCGGVTEPCGECGASGAPSNDACCERPAEPGHEGTREDPDSPGEHIPGDGPGPNGVTPPLGFVFSPYKDVGISLNWNTNVISSEVSGALAEVGPMLASKGAKTVTLAFATGECGAESWVSIPGEVMATANVSRLVAAGVDYIVSTGGAAGAFTCGSDAGFETFLGRWSSARLRGVDFDIEAGQSPEAIKDLVRRMKTAHAVHPSLRFSFTLATLASSRGASAGMSLGANATNSLNQTGNATVAAIREVLGIDQTEGSWPSYVTVNLMTMDYGSASESVCVVAQGKCQMAESAIQAAHNLRDTLHVPYAAIELTPMLGMNDVTDEHFRLEDVDTTTFFALANGLAGIHYWSFDRDRDCADKYASATCNSMGSSYASPLGYLARFKAAGL